MLLNENNSDKWEEEMGEEKEEEEERYLQDLCSIILYWRGDMFFKMGWKLHFLFRFSDKTHS